MNVIGIIQTDLNEFNVLFDQEQNKQGKNQQASGSGESQDSSEDNDSLFLNFLDEDMDQSQNSSGQQNQNQNQSGPQEMTVRIKGIPEGQKANFLQMYQILQDAKDVQSLEKSLTIVQNGAQDGQGAGRNQQVGQKGKAAQGNR